MIDQSNPVYSILVDLKSIQQTLKKRMHNHFKEMALTAPQGMMVMILERHGSLKISEISEKVGLSNSTVSGIVDRLEAQGLVERVRSEKDRRVVNVSNTQLMKDKLVTHDDAMNMIMQNALDIASEEELETVAGGLKILSELLRRTNEGETNA